MREQQRANITAGERVALALMKRFLMLAFVALFWSGCGSIRRPEVTTGAHFRIVTYNVNRGSDPREIAEAIRANGADIVCLQEADGFEKETRRALSKDFQVIKFQDSETRVGGEYGFLSRFPAREVAFVPSDTGWFAGSIMAVETPLGVIQILDVHLKPPVSRHGSFAVGYFTTHRDHRREMERFCSYCDPKLPLFVVGDFNDTAHSQAVRFLKSKGLINALPQFDRRTPTWEWPTRLVTLRRRMDHILYPQDFRCVSARVIRTGPSDHFQVEATFIKGDQ